MCRPSANPARAPSSTTRRFNTGSAPGNPRQVGQVFEFGSSPKRVAQPQKIFDSVLNCAWISRPITVSQVILSLLRSQPARICAGASCFLFKFSPTDAEACTLHFELVQLVRQLRSLVA